MSDAADEKVIITFTISSSIVEDAITDYSESQMNSSFYLCSSPLEASQQADRYEIKPLMSRTNSISLYKSPSHSRQSISSDIRFISRLPFKPDK